MLEKNEIVKLMEENMLDDELVALFRDAHSWDGCFEFIDAYTLDELVHDLCCDPVELIDDILRYEVDDVHQLLRYDSYGWLESLTEDDLIKEAWDNVDELIDWLYDNYSNVSLSCYSMDDEWFEDDESED